MAKWVIQDSNAVENIILQKSQNSNMKVAYWLIH